MATKRIMLSIIYKLSSSHEKQWEHGHRLSLSFIQHTLVITENRGPYWQIYAAAFGPLHWRLLTLKSSYTLRILTLKNCYTQSTYILTLSVFTVRKISRTLNWTTITPRVLTLKSSYTKSSYTVDLWLSVAKSVHLMDYKSTKLA